VTAGFLAGFGKGFSFIWGALSGTIIFALVTVTLSAIFGAIANSLQRRKGRRYYE
jgi:hypothetical protein